MTGHFFPIKEHFVTFMLIANVPNILSLSTWINNSFCKATKSVLINLIEIESTLPIYVSMNYSKRTLNVIDFWQIIEKPKIYLLKCEIFYVWKMTIMDRFWLGISTYCVMREKGEIVRERVLAVGRSLFRAREQGGCKFETGQVLPRYFWWSVILLSADFNVYR